MIMYWEWFRLEPSLSYIYWTKPTISMYIIDVTYNIHAIYVVDNLNVRWQPYYYPSINKAVLKNMCKSSPWIDWGLRINQNKQHKPNREHF